MLQQAMPTEGALEQALFVLEAGGPVIVILLVLSVVALTIVFLTVFQFTMLRVGSRRFVEEALSHWRVGRPGEALSALAPSRNPIARVLETAIRGRMQGRIEEEKVREEVSRVGAAQLENLRAYLRGLELIAMLSPLLGLFGTVLGMIDAFQRLEQAGSRVNPAILSGGIWEALLTTAAGLAVAIPAIAVLTGLERVVDRLGHDMEDAVTQVFTRDLAEPAETPEATRLRAPRAEHAH